MLAFMSAGASYIGDEYIYIDRESGRMFGIRKPVTLWEWHLEELKQYWGVIDARERSRLRTLNTTLKFLEWTAKHRLIPTNLLINASERLADEIQRRMATKIAPEELFGESAVVSEGSIDLLLFTSTHRSKEVILHPLDPSEVAKRMVHSLQHQRLYFLSYYYKFRYAFPDRYNHFIEEAALIEEQALVETLSGKETYGFFHPYPVSFKLLLEALKPILDG